MKDFPYINDEVTIKETVSPFIRPTYQQWAKEMRIGGVAYWTAEDGKQKADEIMKNVGLPPEEEIVFDDIKSFFSKIWNPQ
jgi:hypothetical protein